MRELEFGGRVSAASLSGWTPLHHAVCGGHEEVVEFLLLRGADVNAKTEARYRTPPPRFQHSATSSVLTSMI